MSWSPELFIGELRPWPDTVHVVRGRTGETRRYVPERTCRITGWDPLDDADGYDDRLYYLSCGHTAVVCLGPMGTMDTLDEFVECPECHARVVDE